MATRDDDFDASYDDEEVEEIVEEVEEEEAARRSPLRLILLVLVILILLCIVCAVLGRCGALPLSIPGLSPAPEEPAPVVDTPLPGSELTPTLEAPGGETPAAGETPAVGETPAEGEVPPEGETPVVGETPAEGQLPPEGETPVAGETPAEGEQPTEGEAPAAGETPAEGQLPPEGEQPAEGEPPAEGEQPTEGEPPAEGEPPVEGGEDEVVSEHAEEEVAPGEEATPTPAPGEATPTPAPAAAGCDTNTPPAADAGGPYSAMMGKGEAFVPFDASGSTDADGSIESYGWDFGDGTSATATEAEVTHGYKEDGTYTATLTVTDNCGATDDVTVDVTIVGPTPPAEPTDDSGDDSSDDQGSTSPTPAPAPVAGTVGFCYRVQYGDTLYGIANRFGVFWPDLARVNNVNPGYYVIAGQGLFVPSGEISEPPNVYEVQEGDTLNSIALQCGLSVMALSQANGMAEGDTPTPGDMMVIPPWRY